MASVFNGRRWSPDLLLGEAPPATCLTFCILNGKSLVAVSCTRSRFCMTIDSGTESFAYDGKSWIERPLDLGPVPGVYQGTGPYLSCAGSGLCVAVTDTGITATFDGSQWEPPSQPFGTVVFDDVGCGDSRCTAYDLSGFAYRFNGSSWARPSTTDAACIEDGSCGDFNGVVVRSPTGGAVSCTSASFCMDVTKTRYSVFERHRWLASLSLPTSFSVLYAPSGWSPPHTFQPLLSCVNADFCLMVEQGGESWVWHNQ